MTPAATVVGRLMRRLSHLYPELSHSWRVTGRRTLPDGRVEELSARACGQTEERARSFYRRTQEHPWDDATLTFTREDAR